MRAFERLARGHSPAARASEAIAQLQIARDRLQLRQGVVVGEQPEAEMAVVAHDGDPERLALGERHDRVEDPQAPPEHVERELRAGDVRDDEVEEALACLQARRLAEDRGRREPGEVGQHLRAHGLTGLLQVLHRAADLPQAVRRILDADRQRRPHRGDLVAERSALRVGAHRDGHHRLQHEALGVVALARR